jgi:hypothetical protein
MKQENLNNFPRAVCHCGANIRLFQHITANNNNNNNNNEFSSISIEQLQYLLANAYEK